MGLLTDFYNTVAKFFRPQEETSDEASKSVATNRLKLVLMQDRTNLTPKILEQMRGELVDLLSKYLEMDKELLELNFEQEGDQVALMLSIPVIRAKDEEEIEKAIAEAAEKKSDEAVEEDEASDEEAEEITDSDEIAETKDEESEEEIIEEAVADSEENSEEIQNDTKDEVNGTSEPELTKSNQVKKVEKDLKESTKV
jgi:cell division topological specificity factor